MIDFKNEHTNGHSAGPVHPLKRLDEDQFAALGGQHVVFVRQISAGDLTALIPEAGNIPEDAPMHLVMAANGDPLMVSDNLEALGEWISEQQVEVAQLH